MRRLIERLERVKPHELTDMEFIGVCLCSLAATVVLLIFGSPQ